MVFISRIQARNCAQSGSIGFDAECEWEAKPRKWEAVPAEHPEEWCPPSLAELGTPEGGSETRGAGTGFSFFNRLNVRC